MLGTFRGEMNASIIYLFISKSTHLSLNSLKDVPELAKAKKTDDAGAEQLLLERIFDSTSTSRKLFSFNVCFLRLTARPTGANLTEVARTYDRLLGMPSLSMVSRLKAMLKACQDIKRFPGYFESICMEVPTPSKLYSMYVNAVQVSLKYGYHSADTDFSKVQSRGVSNFLMRGKAYPRIVFCIDCSGSMSTLHMNTASKKSEMRIDTVRNEIEDILFSKLTHRQQFSIIRFDSYASAWQQGLVQATDTNIRDAVRYIRGPNFNPNGGTNFEAALEMAFTMPSVQAVYLLSDGEYFGESESLFRKVENWSRTNGTVCHTTAFCASKQGGDFLKKLAEISNGSFMEISL